MTTAADQAYEILRDAIIGGLFKPGERLVERQLSARLGVSRTPVREALRRLERERFVTTEPFKGVVITKFTLQEAEQLYEFRAAVEGLAADLLARNPSQSCIEKLQECLAKSREALAFGNEQEMARANNAFHQTLGNETGNWLVADAVSKILGYVSVLRLTVWRIRRRPMETLEEHGEILAAIKAKDPEKARLWAVRHVQNSWEAARKVLAQEEGPDLPKIKKHNKRMGA